MLAKETYKYAAEVVEALNEITDKTVEGKGDAVWTQKIKRKVGGLGKENGFLICTSGCLDLKYDTEWLYDLVWYRCNHENNDDGRRLTEVPLVLESEWLSSFEKIRYDFEKLLVANAPIKVMVFCNEDAFEKLKDGIKEYKNGVASIYILACYNESAGNDVSAFKIRAFESNSGVNEITLTELSDYAKE